MVDLLRSFFKTFSVALMVAGVVVVLGIGGFLYTVLKDLPDVASLKEFHHPVATEVFSDDGRKIGEFTTERRYPVRFESIPKHVILAFLAAEDSHFFEHKGIDFTGIFRAVYSNVVKARFAQGGSTITQQVARNLLLTRKKEITRKIRELILARRIEQHLTKNEILSLYLAEIYLGHGAFGIGAAAQNYFHKRVEDLTIAEGAVLAGLPQRPNEWNPFRNPHIAKRRQIYVLRRMVEEKFITEQQGAEAQAQALRLFEMEDLNLTAAPYFVEYVRLYLMNRYGSEKILTQGYKVHTTVQYDAQKAAEAALQKGLREVDKRLGWRGVAVHLSDPTKVRDFRTETHRQILSKLTPARILTADAADKGPTPLLYDVEGLQANSQTHFGPTPLKENELYSAVVHQLEVKSLRYLAYVGDTLVLLPFTGMEWAKSPGEKQVLDPKTLLQAGDTIRVRVEKIDRRSGEIEASLDQEPEVQGAVLAYDLDSGMVRAMVGGKSFEQSKFNCALQAKRQVGSTFKPVLYAAAMDRGFSPASLVTDSPIVFKFEGGLDADNAGEDWRPRNYSGTFEGDIPLRLALIRSMNIPTVKLLNELGVDYGIQYARNLGISAVLPRDLSIGLGSWSSSLEELTRAYAVFPRLGSPVALTYIKSVIDEAGNTIEGKQGAAEPLKIPQTVPKELADQGIVMSPQTAYVMVDMLKGVVREGTGRAAVGVGAPVAGKTGTSNDHRDAWFVGFTPSVMAGVWIGYEKDKPLDPAETGGKAAAPIWTEFMAKVVPKYPKGDFPIPEGIVFAYIDRTTGKPAGSRAPNRVRVAFKPDQVPNATGSNLRRIGEPGARSTSNVDGQGHRDDNLSKDSETSDFLRQGYQD